MVERLRNQAVRSHNRRPSIVAGMHRRGIFLGIERALAVHRVAHAVVILRRDRANPGHEAPCCNDPGESIATCAFLPITCLYYAAGEPRYAAGQARARVPPPVVSRRRGPRRQDAAKIPQPAGSLDQAITDHSKEWGVMVWFSGGESMQIEPMLRDAVRVLARNKMRSSLT